MNKLYYKTMASPVGFLKLVASDKGLVAVLWEDDDPKRVRLESLIKKADHPILMQVEHQLREYFAGTRSGFEIETDFVGTDFQRSVWQALLQIPFGETRSYAQIAQAIGRPEAARAVGGAIGKNPLSIVVPCHRVNGSDGSLTGFAGGLPTKRFLLAHEEGDRSSYARSSVERQADLCFEAA